MTVEAKIRTSATSIPEGELARQLLAGKAIWNYYDVPHYPFEVPDHSTSPGVPARSFHGVDKAFLTGALRPASSFDRDLLTDLLTRTMTEWIFAPHHGDAARITHLIESRTISDHPAQFFTFVLATDHSTDPLPPSFSSNWLYGERTVDSLEGYEQYTKPNWDSYDAQPITAETLAYARRLLQVMPDTFGPPDIAPSADGSIGLEWVPDASPLAKLFLDIGPGEEWRAYWKRRNGEFGRLPGNALTLGTQRILRDLFDDLSK